MEAEKLITVALADDHKIFKDGVKMSLKDRELIKILWETGDGNDLMHKLKVKQPDVMLMDVNLPGINGVTALQMIRKSFQDLKIVIISMYDDKETITKMMEYGANAFLPKTSDPDEIYKAIVSCMNEDFYFNDLVNTAVLLRLQQRRKLRRYYPADINFNDKELRILKLIAEDKTTEEISENVYLSPRTVETIRQNMKSKVGAKTVAGLVMYAMRNKLVE